MRKVWAAALASVSFAVSNGVFAQEATASDNPDSAPSKAVRLNDAELDQITAGSVLTVIIAPPSDVFHLQQNDHVSVIIFGAGKGSDIFGSVVMVSSGGAVKTIIIPGGPLERRPPF